MNTRSKSAASLKVVLGCQTTRAFAAAPRDYDVIGIVRMGRGGHEGMEFGLLAKTELGVYVSVNGSTVMPLNSAVVEEAMRVARVLAKCESYTALSAQTLIRE